MNNNIKNTTDWRNPSNGSPIFIIGCQRSGTTLLRTILHSHPNISIGYECAFYKILAEKYYHSSSIIERLDEFIEDLYKVRRFDLWNLEKEFLRSEFLKVADDINYAQAVLFIAELCRQKHKPNASIIGFKNPNGILHIPFIFELYPNARVIHIIRDVRGIYASEKKKRVKTQTYNAAYYLYKVSSRYKAAVQAFDKYINDNRVYPLLYRDLVQNTENTISDLCNWLNIQSHEQMFSYFNINKDQQLTPKQELWQHGKTLEAPDSSRVNAFCKELNDSELRAIELLCRREIIRFSEDIDFGFSSFKGIPLILKAFGERVMDKLVPKT